MTQSSVPGDTIPLCLASNVPFALPIGEASCRTHNENGLAVWTLRIGKEEIPGGWVIVDRRFRLVK
jgi:hypothetical protein